MQFKEEFMIKSPSGEGKMLLVDGMLGSLSRKLRVLGYDTVYDSKSSDKNLLKFAKDTGRILVTADADLFLTAKRAKTDSILVSSRTEHKRLFEVLSKIGAHGINDSVVARCSVCNGELKDSGRVNHVSTVYTCVACGKDYWKGSHWKNLSELFHEVDAELRKTRMNLKAS
ncbi:MAG: Mut7-C RNAse domain-containing protein [Nitrososphaerales archaeon]